MTQADRDRLVALKKVKKRLITQGEAAAELELSVRQVKRLLKALKKHGDKAVVHGLRGRPSNHRFAEKVRTKAIQILSQDVYRGFGPTLAGESLANKHGIVVSHETLRKWRSRRGFGGHTHRAWRKCICIAHGEAVLASWCSGTPAITTGWKDGDRGFT